mmetsp:Transcript_31690/g.59089  ORF Transcript_31690/g.59089 Transcript_31690/m.59089 type:complete len:266 (+) Transcript_31690:1120-1917(+)
MSTPVWPPARFPISSAMPTSSSAKGDRPACFVIFLPNPPALPAQIWCSDSESTFIIMSLFKKPGDRPAAPRMSFSSADVNKISIWPALNFGSCKIAIAAATPIPLSAPRVVLSAFNHPSSTYPVIGSTSKLCNFPFACSQTISMCAWIATLGAFSYPGLAGRLSSRLPCSSVSTEQPFSVPFWIAQSLTRCSLKDALGICIISTKLLNTLCFGSCFKRSAFLASSSYVSLLSFLSFGLLTAADVAPSLGVDTAAGAVSTETRLWV